MIDINNVPMDEECRIVYEMENVDTQQYEQIRIHGLISSCLQGRSNTNRQYIFVNNRPCHFKQINTLVNELYHQYNKAQYPVLFLYITLANEHVDVNRAPDKRLIFVADDRCLLAKVRTCVGAALTINAGTCPSAVLAKVEHHSPLVNRRADQTEVASSSSTPTPSGSKRILADGASGQNIPKQRKLSLFNFEAFNGGANAANATNDVSVNVGGDKPLARQHDVNENGESSRPTPHARLVTTATTTQAPRASAGADTSANTGERKAVQRGTRQPVNTIDVCMQQMRKAMQRTLDTTLNVSLHMPDLVAFSPDEDVSGVEYELTQHLHKRQFAEMTVVGQFNKGFIIALLDKHLFIIDQHASDEKYMYEMYTRNSIVQAQKLFSRIPLSLSSPCESVLRAHVSTFARNGFEFQFNDEQDDYEGCSAPPRVFLTAVPSMAGNMFGVDDVHEMLVALQEPHATSLSRAPYRPPKVRRIFASKACRKAVMIGAYLNHDEMLKIVRHLAELQQPWVRTCLQLVNTVLQNCPHGRPTLRHLIAVDSI